MAIKKPRSGIREIGMAIDLGASLTKIVAGAEGKKEVAYFLKPEVIRVEKESIERYEREAWGETEPQNQAWVAVGGKHYAVGHLARYKFWGNAGLNQLKSSRGTYKILAAVWVIARMWQLGNHFQLSLSLLLPPGELKEKEELEQLLRKALASFKTPTGEMRVELKKFSCLPEGGGIFIMHRKKRGEVEVQRQVTAVLMLGYRNASLMVSQQGVISDFLTSDLGFVKLLKEIANSSSGQSIEKLLVPVVAAGSEVRKEALVNILRSEEEAAKKRELEELRAVIGEARKKYASALQNWLSEVMPLGVDEIVLGGGTADAMRTEIRQILVGKNLYWHAQESLPQELALSDMSNRFVDVWCLWCYFRERIFTLPKRRRRRKKLEVATAS